MPLKRLAIVATAAGSPTPAPLFNPNDLLSIDEVALRLRADVSWVREKIRRRCPNPMPCFNVGRHLLFHWPAVCAWIASSPRPIHAAHPPRRRKKLAKAA